jgi:L-lactate dehydrogenase complex protein LldG
MSARDHILTRLGRARPAEPTAMPDVAAYYAAHRRVEPAPERMARFSAAMRASHAEIHDTDTEHWPQLLCEIAKAKGLRKLLVGAGSVAAAALRSRGDLGFELLGYDRPVEDWRSALFDDIDAAVSVARSAIAETGTLVLWPGPAEPRLMSLVPPTHFVLLDAAAIHADFGALMSAERWAGGLPANVLLISGPSKTADIQQVLAYGAHGPRELVVLLCHAE